MEKILFSVVPDTSKQAPVTAIGSPEGSSSAPVNYSKTDTTGCQASKKHISLDPLVLRDLNSAFRTSKDPKGHKAREELVAPSSSPGTENDPNESDAYTTVSTIWDQGQTCDLFWIYLSIFGLLFLLIGQAVKTAGSFWIKIDHFKNF